MKFKRVKINKNYNVKLKIRKMYSYCLKVKVRIILETSLFCINF